MALTPAEEASLRAARATLAAALITIEGILPHDEPEPAGPPSFASREECAHERREIMPAPRDPGRTACVNPRCRKLFPSVTEAAGGDE